MGVVVVGAGMGGLAAAIDLARAGRSVTVVEGADRPGGKMRERWVGGVPIDSGPTVLTMKWVFERLFADAGVDFDDRVPTRRAEVLARHAWSDESNFDLFADPERTHDAIGRFAGAREARGYAAFRAQAREICTTLEDTFIRAPKPSALGLVQRMGFGGLGRLWRIRPYELMWRELGRYFSDPRLVQLFARYATYCGSSPFFAPATLMLVAHVELEGVWLVRGGMQRLADGLANLATQLGATIRYGARVDEVLVRGGRTHGVRLHSGEEIEADQVLLNADASSVADAHLGRDAASAVPSVARKERSLSALTVSAFAETDGFPLARHTVFFGDEYADEFDDLFERRQLPEDPTVYVCAQDRDVEGRDIDGPERLFVIINAPADGDVRPFGTAEIESCATRAFTRMQRCGLRIRRTPANHVITSPTDFERRFPGTGGALYGRATHGPTATFARPSAQTKIGGLYLAGGSVHPGPGVPMATLSGRLAASALLADSPSTARSSRAVMHGGTSMR